MVTMNAIAVVVVYMLWTFLTMSSRLVVLLLVFIPPRTLMVVVCSLT
jgi:hypothetical protein